MSSYISQAMSLRTSCESCRPLPKEDPRINIGVLKDYVKEQKALQGGHIDKKTTEDIVKFWNTTVGRQVSM